jgi:opacity protein-like surface antigen
LRVIVESLLRLRVKKDGVMVSVKVASVAGAIALLATAANAADMPSLPPMYVPPIEEAVGGWYLRGDIGMSNQQVGSLFNALYSTATSVTTVNKSFDSGQTFGLGVGYQFNDWLRADVTGEYRGRANFHGFDRVQAGGPFSDEYTASKSEWLMLANIYADLGTWYSVTPFVGAGIGAARVTIANFMDINTPTGGVAFGDTASKWNFAWAVHAGLAYKVTPRLSIEFAYSYVSLGNGMSGDLITYQGGNSLYNPMEFRNITSQDLKLGIRWMLEPPAETQPMMLPPLMRRG